MNKRIQKKVAKREAELRALAEAQAENAPEAPRATVRSVAEQALQLARDGGALGVVRAVAGEVQERTTEAIDQAKEQLMDKVAAGKQIIAQQEQRAEEVLEKVPVIGAAAAKKLHELTHR